MTLLLCWGDGRKAVEYTLALLEVNQSSARTTFDKGRDKKILDSVHLSSREEVFFQNAALARNFIYLFFCKQLQIAF